MIPTQNGVFGNHHRKISQALFFDSIFNGSAIFYVFLENMNSYIHTRQIVMPQPLIFQPLKINYDLY